MAPHGRKFSFDVLTLEGVKARTDAVSVVFPAVDGMVGVLGGRAPLIAAVGNGRLTVQDTQGQRTEYFLAGGVAHVRQDAMTILADECQPLQDIQPDQAARVAEAAQKDSGENPLQQAAHRRALNVARARLDAVEKYRGRAHGSTGSGGH